MSPPLLSAVSRVFSAEANRHGDVEASRLSAIAAELSARATRDAVEGVRGALERGAVVEIASARVCRATRSGHRGAFGGFVILDFADGYAVIGSPVFRTSSAASAAAYFVAIVGPSAAWEAACAS